MDLSSNSFQQKMVQEFLELFEDREEMQQHVMLWSKISQAEKEKQSTKISFLGANKNVWAFKPFLELYVKFLQNNYPEKINLSRELLQIANLQQLHLQYPFTRELKRKFIFHSGPTNSGKTYTALQKLSQAKSGIYCAPLRLLAAEVQQKLEEQNSNLQCNLETGQEKIIKEGAQFTSCTVELATNKFVNQCENIFDCAVVDEVQLIGDFERGSSWTNIILGLPAKEIHLCGDLKAMAVVKKIIKQCGDEFEEFSYKRRSNLVLSHKLFNYSDLQPGDCLIGFSSRTILDLKKKINQIQPKDQCAILYGRLPPQVRKQQASLFNSQQYSYLVATDVIGMGLNFNIKRIIFTELKKNDTYMQKNNSLYLQIAGRAGRDFQEGTIMCTNQKDLNHIRYLYNFQQSYENYINDRTFPEKLKQYSEKQIEKFKLLKKSIKRAGLFPSVGLLKDFKKILEELTGKQYKLSEVLLIFVNISQLDSIYFIQKYGDFRDQADLIDHLGLEISDQFIFAQAPINFRGKHNISAQYLVRFAEEFKTQEFVQFPNIFEDFNFEYSRQCLEQLQQFYNVTELYMWMHNRFPTIFIDKNQALESIEKIIKLIEQILDNFQ